MIQKLRFKFLLVNMMIVTLMLAVIFGLVIYFTKTNLEQESLQLLRSVAAMPLQPGHPPELPDKMGPAVFSIFKTPQDTYHASGNSTLDFSDEALLSTLYETALQAGKQGVLQQYNLRFFVRDTPMQRCITFTDISGEQTALRQLIKTCCVIAVLGFGAFFVISLFLARWMVKPVDTAWNQQKQFVADASHELKTPLTVIMTNAELLQDDHHTAEKRAQFSDNILTMAKQMRGLTENLLELARSDTHTAGANLYEIDFSGLIADAVLPFEPLYYEKGLALQCHIEKELFVKGDSVHLCRLADILLDNAMKYATPESTVEIRLQRHSHVCVLAITSCGDAISKADLKNIFKRFYRIDKARSANCSYGLGLSIAEHIAKEHGGRIWAESKNNRNSFYVQLPLMQSKKQP